VIEAEHKQQRLHPGMHTLFLQLAIMALNDYQYQTVNNNINLTPAQLAKRHQPPWLQHVTG